MEELQVIETTSGRQFKPWATKDDIQDPASVTAVASEIASGKQVIVAAIEAMGGTADITMSFAELADVIRALPAVSLVSTEGLSAVGAPVNLLKWLLNAKGDLDSNFTEINDNSILSISISYAFAYCSALQSVTMPSLTTITGGAVFAYCSALQSVTMPSLTTITGDSVFANCSALQRLYLPNITTITGSMRGSGIKEFICPKLTNILGGIFYLCSLTNVVVGTLTSMGEPFTYKQPDLRNVTIGAETDINIPLQNWAGTNFSPTELNENLYNNLLTKLYDHSQDGQTRTLRIGWLANVTAENIAYANAKGWTLTT